MRHWAYQPPKRPAIPSVKHAAWVRNPIDVFVLASLEAAGVQPPRPADRRTLLRRVYLDLIGLPPTREEQARFLGDRSANAYERVVDELLALPQYGERWARHWLDVVRYAESNGYERDSSKPSAWRYRDYVIHSLNADKPYNRFITEQIAGDELPDANAETLTGTSFLRIGAWDDEPPDPEIDRFDQLDDVMGTTATAVLGITLRCARCHDHKFEPFSQKDYYRMLALFAPLKRPPTNEDVRVGTQVELSTYQERTKAADRDIAEVEVRAEPIRKPLREMLFQGGKSGFSAEVIAAYKTDPARRDNHQKELIAGSAAELEKKILALATPEDRKRLQEYDQQIAARNAMRPPEPPRAYIWTEEGRDAPATHVLLRGEPKQVGAEVSPGFPEVLIHQAVEPLAPTAKSTGRLWFAHWLTSPQNPLTARVIVNRVWQHHFGEGLVATANDFGVMGRLPSNPALMDWLAVTFMQGDGTADPKSASVYACDWRLKKLHRLIVLSNAYRCTSEPSAEAMKKDPENRLLSRWPSRRLEAEVIRDSTLAVAGLLNLELGGPSIYPKLPDEVLQGQSRPGDGWGQSTPQQAARRSIYIFSKRSLAVPELEALDTPDTSSSCEARLVSTVAPQALTFMNGRFTQDQSQALARRLAKEAGDTSAARIRLAYELALCRQPNPGELTAALSFLAAHALQIEADARSAGKPVADARGKALEAFCLILVNSNEFFYTE